MLEQHLQDTFATGTPLTYENCVACISAEASHQVDNRSLSGKPGSEYVNTVITSRGGNTNSITGLWKHQHNPEGVFCTTPGCGKGDHDHPHCYGKGGGMEGQAPWQKGKKPRETAASAVAPASTPTPPAVAALVMAPNTSSSITAFTRSSAAAGTFLADLLCASIVELDDAPHLAAFVSNAFTTILDSGTTSMLIRDRSSFWAYSTADPVVVHTANHGSLTTSG